MGCWSTAVVAVAGLGSLRRGLLWWCLGCSRNLRRRGFLLRLLLLLLFRWLRGGRFLRLEVWLRVGRQRLLGMFVCLIGCRGCLDSSCLRPQLLFLWGQHRLEGLRLKQLQPVHLDLSLVL